MNFFFLVIRGRSSSVYICILQTPPAAEMFLSTLTVTWHIVVLVVVDLWGLRLFPGSWKRSIGLVERGGERGGHDIVSEFTSE